MSEAQPSPITLAPGALKSAEFVRQVWRIVVPAGTKVADMLKPAYWGHVAPQLRPGDLIESVTEDNSLFCEFLVRYSRRLEASVSLLREVQLVPPTITEQEVAEYQVVFRGARSKHTVLKGQSVIKDGFDTDGQAKAWLTDYLKGLAA